MSSDPRLDEAMEFFASMLIAASKSDDPRLVRAFRMVPRHLFLPPGPWKIPVAGQYVETPSADPIHVYQNILVALDVDKKINNGEPLLHAAWIGKVAPAPGETVVHIGTGTGYYTALLSMLVRPDGHVTGFEIEPDLAATARQHLKLFDNVTVIDGNAATKLLPAADVIYVNAGVVAPPLTWLDALKPSGRLLFPWRPAPEVGLAILIRRTAHGFAVEPVMPSWFIPCVGASEVPEHSVVPTTASAWKTRALHKTSDRAPDDSATAVFGDVWFSSAPVS